MNPAGPMDPDKYQQAWQAHSSQTRIRIDTDLLLKVIQLDQRSFRSGIIGIEWVGGVMVLLLLIPFWIYLGVTTSSPWTWYLTVPVLIWNVVFTLIYRVRRKQKPGESGEPLLQCVKESLTQLEDEVWLQRNVPWWNFLPLSVSILAFAVHSAWLRSQDGSDSLDSWGTVVFLLVFFYCLCFLHRYFVSNALRAKFDPRREELLTLLTSLRDEASSEDLHKTVTASISRLAEGRLVAWCGSPTRIAISLCGLVVAALLVVLVLYFAAGHRQAGYPKKSPFAAVRWQGSQPEVQLGEEWFKLVSLDELPAAEIVAFSRRTYGDLWRKRFEEDLVELLTGMKHPPQDTVALVVESRTSSKRWVREAVPMTTANRHAIQQAAQARAIPEPRRTGVARPAVSIEDTEQFRKRVHEFLQLARVNAGFSGVVLVARSGEPVYEGAVGYSHLASRIPNSVETPFLIASLSKQFTAAAILSLEAEGELSVDEPVHRYLPEFAGEPYRGITIYHLLTHTSGLPRTPEDATRHARWDAMSKAPTPVSDYVRLACQVPLKFEPGQGYQYSNFGYRLLSALIVRISGEQYADFMEMRLFEPLGLRQSGVARISQPRDKDRVAEVVSLIAMNRRSREPSFVRSDNGRNYGTGYGSGGIYTSATDLLQWDRVLAGDSFLSAEQKAKLFRPVTEHYACGWIVKKSSLDGRIYQTHSGANGGYFSKMMRIPEDDLVIIALGNARQTDEIDDALDQLFLLCRSLPYRDL